MYHQNRSEEFIKSVVQKMCMPGGKSIVALSKEIGVCDQTLYNWRKMIQNKVTEVSQERSPRGWKLSDKYQAVIDSANKSGEDLGIWLRKNGLQTAHIELWKEECKTMLAHNVYKEENKILKKRNAELEKDNMRKDKTIAEVTALLVLKKKAKALGLIEED